MFCPQCQAEYRPGFHRCADCEVELVDNPSEAASVLATPPEKYGALLWRGDDPHFYVSLVSSVGRELPCYGRPQNPPVSGFGSQFHDETPGGFEVWVSEADLPRAKWILESVSTTHEEDPPEDRDVAKRGVKKVEKGEPIGVCPLCFAEFDTASSLCPNCSVPLHLGQIESGEDTGVRVLADLVHPQFVVELRQALQEARIPFNNSSYSAGDIVTGRSYVPIYEVLVLDSDFDRATRIMAQVLQHWEFEPSAGLGFGRKLLKAFWPRRADENFWQLQDLNTLLWSGANLSSMNSIGMALRENRVPYRVDDLELGTAKIFIHPEDEPGAREILAQVLEGIPPAEV